MSEKLTLPGLAKVLRERRDAQLKSATQYAVDLNGILGCIEIKKADVYEDILTLIGEPLTLEDKA